MRSILVLALLCGTAFADTGGRMGGGNWSRPSGGSTSIGGSSSSSSSSSSSFGGGSHWSDPPTYHYDPPVIRHEDHGPSSPGSDVPRGSGVQMTNEQIEQFLHPATQHDSFDLMFKLVFVFIALIWVSMFVGAKFDFHLLDLLRAHPDDPSKHVDVGAIRIAIDGRARKFVQTALRQISASTNTLDSTSRIVMLQKVSALLRQLRSAWVYGGFVNEKMGDMDREKPLFDKLVDDTRVKFMRETVSNVDGTLSPADPGHDVPRPEEGEGLILVSIILAAYKELYTVKKVGNGDDLRDALEAVQYLDETSLVAVQIIWQPSEENDRMSSIELEAKYPGPQLVPIKGALVGKTFCTHCAGPFPRELTSCPFCGAPARDVA
ncbi:MAG: DUF1517 domain-containing protein [Kofleriaceae bacterium]